MDPAQQPRRIEYVPLSRIRPAARNPRVHDEPSIRAAIVEFGFNDALVEDARTGRLTAGHGRLKVLVELYAEGARVPDGILIDPDTGEWMVPVQRGWGSANDIVATAALVGHNRATENARWNDWGLAELIEEVATARPALMDGMGVDEEFLDELLAGVNPERLGEQDPDLPAPIDKPPAPLDDGAQAQTKDEHDSDDPDPDNITCVKCGHRFPRKV